MKILFWLVFWLFFMPQLPNFLINQWDIISKAPAIILSIFIFCALISAIILNFIYKMRYEGEINQLKGTIEQTKEASNTLNERLKGRDEEISKLKEKVINNQENIVEKHKTKTIKELSNKEIAGVTINIAKQIQQSIIQWENYNEKNYATETEKQMFLMNEYFSKYLDNVIALKREISLRISPDKTGLIEGYYISAHEKDKILLVCDDLIELANKVSAKK